MLNLQEEAKHEMNSESLKSEAVQTSVVKVGKRERLMESVVCAIVVTLSIILIARYLCMGNLTLTVVMLAIHVLLALASYIAMCSRCYILSLIQGVCCIILGTMNTFSDINIWLLMYFVMAATGIISGLVGYYFRIKEKTGLQRMSVFPVLAFVLIVALTGGTWGIQTMSANASEGRALRSVWSVPDIYDEAECTESGNLTTVTYETKAYATDERTVEKSCNVYLPYGYDEAKQYNILYLMHGTGDDENYWLIKNANNKTMLDNLIATGEIDPMIVVTPTWYVEDDCSEDLDQLTYSFAKELRNDLIPVIEGTYSTYAASTQKADLIASREHRAFAGLSRGSATMYHTAMQQELDIFAWFGGFSASRITEEEWTETAMSEELKDYPISYLYVTTGTSDFAAERQLADYDMLLGLDKRFTEGRNTSFDVFPMRYHSAGSWHLALYNYVQKIF